MKLNLPLSRLLVAGVLVLSQPLLAADTVATVGHNEKIAASQEQEPTPPATTATKADPAPSPDEDSDDQKDRFGDGPPVRLPIRSYIFISLPIIAVVLYTELLRRRNRETSNETTDSEDD
jgi:hypothetical protein